MERAFPEPPDDEVVQSTDKDLHEIKYTNVGLTQDNLWTSYGPRS